MPKYIDFHAKLPAIPPEALNEMRKKIGVTDQHGVKSVDAFITKDGQGYCVTEAPNVDAVCKSHESMGMSLGQGDVHEVAAELARA